MQENLIKAGFNKNESKIYLTLIKKGPSSAGEISKKSGVYRTNVYDALNSLIEKGLVAYIFKGKLKTFQAINPNKLLDIVKEKEESLKEIMPDLVKHYKTTESKQKMYMFEGIQGIKAITDDILKDKKDVLTFGIPKDMKYKMKSFLKSYHLKRMKSKIWQKHIYDENAAERINHLNKLKYTRAAYLPNSIDSPTTTTVYGNKVSFFIWSDPIISILIESENMAKEYKKYFNVLWKLSKKP
ncbi:winged helix-turn-helix transcriptional regulator [archaeon]|nr:winged helix-turn-helix transcriptional regulator [archaeon]